MSHPFDRYLQKHGHYPTLRISSGSQQITVEFAPKYVRIRTAPPCAGEVYLMRSTLIKFLKNKTVVKLLAQMRGDFNVPAAVHRAHLFEMRVLDEKRARKRTEAQAAKRNAQRRRWKAARVRAQRQADDS